MVTRRQKRPRTRGHHPKLSLSQGVVTIGRQSKVEICQAHGLAAWENFLQSKPRLVRKGRGRRAVIAQQHDKTLLYVACDTRRNLKTQEHSNCGPAVSELLQALILTAI